MSDTITDPTKYVRGWRGGLPETPCGHGSLLSTTVQQRAWIPKLIDKYGIRTIADIGAGDLNWIKHTDLRGAQYAPYDLVPRKPEVKQFDLVNEVPPKVDMLMCLWVLNHLTYEQCQAAIRNLRASGSKYLLMTERERYKADSPPEADMPHIEAMRLNEKNDFIKLVVLND